MELVQATGELIERHAHEIPSLAWSTGPISYEYHFDRRALFDSMALRSWRTPGTLFSSDATTLAVKDGELLGMTMTMLGPEFRLRSEALGALWVDMLHAGETDEEEISGILERSRLASWLNPVIHSSTYYVHAIAVKPEARGQRIGNRLLQHAIDVGQELGCKELQLDVLSDNPAVGFYRSMGLAVLAETKAPKPLEFGVPPEIRMGKSLR